MYSPGALQSDGSADDEVQIGLINNTLRDLIRHRATFSHESASTASQRRREKQSFGEDLDYVLSGTAPSAIEVGELVTKIMTRAQKRKQQVNVEGLRAFAQLASQLAGGDSESEDDNEGPRDE